MIYPKIRPQHRNSPDLHNVISQIVQNAQKKEAYVLPSPSIHLPSTSSITTAAPCYHHSKRIIFRTKGSANPNTQTHPKTDGYHLSTLEGTHHYQPPGTLHGKSCCALELRHRGYYRTRGKEPEVGGRNWRNDSFWKMLYSRRVGTKKEENGRY